MTLLVKITDLTIFIGLDELVFVSYIWTRVSIYKKQICSSSI